MDSAKVVSRSNSDSLSIQSILNDTSIPAEFRMELVARIARDWEAAVQPTAAFKAHASRAKKMRDRRIADQYHTLMLHKAEESKVIK